MKLYTYLLTKTATDNFTNQKKAKALISILLIFILVSTTFTVIGLLTGGSPVRTIAFTAINIIMLFTFVLLRKFGFSVAGNYFSLAVVVGSLASLNLTGTVPPLYTPYVSGFYILFGILVVTSLFSTRKTLMLNVVLITIGVLIFFFRTRNLYPNVQLDMQLMARDAIIRFFVILIAIIISLDFILRLNNFIIKQIAQTAQIKNQQNERLNELINSIKQTSDNLDKLSVQINLSSNKLHESADNQATNIQKVTEHVEILSNTLTQNASSAQNTMLTATKASELATISEKALQESIASNQAINSKISIISKIAAKTDMLSINAAIEANRAGEHGKGFAVVANEIRKLADVSNYNSATIIQLALQNSEASDTTSQTIGQLIQEVKKTHSYIAEISALIQEQKTGIDEIKVNMQEINNFANSNAQLAADLAANLEILNKNAQALANNLKNNK